MIFIPTEGYTKRAARILKEVLDAHSVETTHSKCLDILSRMFGHSAWWSMRKAMQREQPSLFDRDVPSGVAAHRRRRQVEALVEFGLDPATAQSVAADVDASNRIGRHAPSDVDRIRFIVDAGGMEEAEKIAYEALHKGDREVFDLICEFSRTDARWKHVEATACLMGHGTDPDPVKAAELLEEALKSDVSDHRKGFIAATLGNIAGGNYGVPADREKEMRYYRLAAMTYDNPMAAFNLGLRYQEGSPSDVVFAADMFAQAVRGGSVEALTNLGLLLMRTGLRRSGYDPLDLLALASQAGDGVAATALAELERTGLGEKYRRGEAFEISRRSPSLEERRAAVWSVVMGIHGWPNIVSGEGLLLQRPDGRRIQARIDGPDESVKTAPDCQIVLMSSPVIEGDRRSGYVLRIGHALESGGFSPAYMSRGEAVDAGLARKDAVKMSFMAATEIVSKFHSLN